MFTLIVSLWESIQKSVLYWQVYLIKDHHSLDMFLHGMWILDILGLTGMAIHHLMMQT